MADEQTNENDNVEEKTRKLQEATKGFEAERRRLEELKADKLLAGVAEAGHPAPKKTVESSQEYAARVLRGDV